jgi:flagellar basal-body rod protein FlgF
MSNQMAKSRQLQITSNNIANVNTKGYKRSNVTINRVMNSNLKKQVSFPLDSVYYISHEKSALISTERNLDVAIVGEGYFKVQGPNNKNYLTADGRFFISNNGTIVNGSGYSVLSIDDNIINVGLEYRNITITKSGQVGVDGAVVGAIGVFNASPEMKMHHVSLGLFDFEGEPTPSESPSMLSGFIMESNVNQTEEMTNLIEIQRSYEFSTQLISQIYDNQSSVISKLGK